MFLLFYFKLFPKLLKILIWSIPQMKSKGYYGKRIPISTFIESFQIYEKLLFISELSIEFKVVMNRFFLNTFLFLEILFNFNLGPDKTCLMKIQRLWKFFIFNFKPPSFFKNFFDKFRIVSSSNNYNWCFVVIWKLNLNFM